MSTLFPSSELDRKLGEATSNENGLPSSGLLYELGRACHRDDDYRIITSQIWQTVLRSNQVRRPPKRFRSQVGGNAFDFPDEYLIIHIFGLVERTGHSRALAE